MSNLALNWAVHQTVGDPSAKALLMVLADFADDRCSCYPSQETLARITELSLRAVNNGLKRLEHRGFIIRIRAARREDGRGRFTRYFLTLDAPLLRASAGGEKPSPEPSGAGLENDSTPETMPGPTAPGAVEQSDQLHIATRPTAPGAGNPSGNPVEREGARAKPDEQGGSPTAVTDEAGEATWQTLLTGYPTAAYDDLAKARAAFDLLPDADRVAAVERLPDFLAGLAERKRKHPPSVGSYLADRRWEFVPERAAAAEKAGAPPAYVMLPAFSRAWWWMLYERVRTGALPAAVNGTIASAVNGTGYGTTRPPTAEEEAAMARLHRDGEGFAAWQRHLAGKGIRLAKPAIAEFVWAPADWPPEGEARAGPAALSEEEVDAFAR